MKAGRPTLYSDELADHICERLADGESMRSICRSDDMPCLSTVFKWLRENDTFSQQYAIAKEECADALVEDMLDIADNQVDQPLVVDGVPMVLDGKMVMIKDAVSVNHARLRVDTRKWAASKLKPKKYGDKVTNELVGDGGGPVKTESTVKWEILPVTPINQVPNEADPKGQS